MRKVRDITFLTQFGKRMPSGNEIALIAQNQLRIRYEAKGLDSFDPSYLRAHYAALYNSNPAECLLVTAKRTLRERWRQIIIEGFKSPQYFLVTIDAKQSSHSIKEMAGHRIYLVVPASIIQNTPRYQSAGNVISFRAFLDNYLDPAMRRWRQAGIIS